MNVDEALARIQGRDLPVRASFRPLAELDGEMVSSFPVTAIATEALAPADAVALLRYFLDHRAELGLTPILVEERAREYLRASNEGWAWPKAEQVRGDLAKIEELEARLRPDRFEDADLPSIEAALDVIERHVGGSLDARTEPLDWEDMQALEAGESSEDFDEDSEEDAEEKADAEEEGAEEEAKEDAEEEEDAEEAEAAVKEEEPASNLEPVLPSGLLRQMAAASEASGGRLDLGALRPMLQVAAPVLPAATPEAAFEALATGGRCHVVLFDCPSYLTLYFLGYGDWNDCPGPIEQAARWRGWHARHGAEVVQVGWDTVVGFVARPAVTRVEVARLAAEMIDYSTDNVIEGMAPLIATLFRSHAWSIWWD